MIPGELKHNDALTALKTAAKIMQYFYFETLLKDSSRANPVIIANECSESISRQWIEVTGKCVPFSTIKPLFPSQNSKVIGQEL